MSRQVELQVTVAHGHLLEEVAREISAKGFNVRQVLKEIDVIVGSAPAEAVERVKQVKGVVAVEEQPRIEIGRPDGDQVW